jgi:hypothetical protein
MSAVATFDPSRKLTLYLRVGMDGSKTFNFSDSAGVAYDISDLTFQMLIYERVGGSIYLTWDSQLTKPTNYSMKITYTDTESSAIQAKTYFYIIKRTTGAGLVKTWFNGPLIAHQGEFDGVTSTDDFVIDDAGASISVTISDSPNTLSVSTTTSTATLTPNGSFDAYELTAQITALTIANPSTDYSNFDGFMVRFYTASSQTLALGNKFRAQGEAFITSTTAGKFHILTAIFDSTNNKYDTRISVEV